MTRTAWIVSGTLAALLVLVAVLLIVGISTINQQAAEADYRRCMETMGALSAAPGETIETYSTRAAGAAEWCLR